MLGLETADVQADVFNALRGQFGEQALPTGEQIKWQVRYKIEGSIADTLDAVPVSAGSALRLSDVVDADFDRAMTQIRRRDGKVSVEVTGYNDSEVISLADIRSHITDEIIPKISADFDVDSDQGGHIRTQDKTMQQVAMAFALGLGLIYTVLSLKMRSFVTPLLIMGILPFGAAGMILGHFILEYTLTLLSIVALVGLFGVLVNDSILLFDEIQSRRENGEDWRSAVHSGYSHRLRAILLTSITTILGLLPLLLETSYQAQFLVPIAITISFGLGVSTLASFFLVPAAIAVFVKD
jgi:multidrug efflux pump subunit AcrB